MGKNKNNDDTDNDVDFDFSDNSEEDFELHTAARKGDVGKLMALLEGGGFDINSKGNNGTALHSAAKNGHMGTIRYLLSNGADKTILDNDGKTAADLADQNTHFEVADWIRDFKNEADVSPPIIQHPPPCHEKTKPHSHSPVHFLPSPRSPVPPVSPSVSPDVRVQRSSLDKKPAKSLKKVRSSGVIDEKKERKEKKGEKMKSPRSPETKKEKSKSPSPGKSSGKSPGDVAKSVGSHTKLQGKSYGKSPCSSPSDRCAICQNDDVPAGNLRVCAACSQKFCPNCMQHVQRKMICGRGGFHVFYFDLPLDAEAEGEGLHSERRKSFQSNLRSKSQLMEKERDDLPDDCYRCAVNPQKKACVVCRDRYCDICAEIKTFKNPCLNGGPHTYQPIRAQKVKRSNSAHARIHLYCDRCAKEEDLLKICLKCKDMNCDGCCSLSVLKNPCIDGCPHKYIQLDKYREIESMTCCRCGTEGTECKSCLRCCNSFCKTCCAIRVIKNPCINGASHIYDPNALSPVGNPKGADVL